MNDGDWICSDANCGNINFARRTSCYRCNKERPDSAKASKKKLGTEIGKSAAEKSRGLFNADDWQCNKCANVNWARRQTCNVCNAPKFGEVEARTGYGGGYNERGAVEYRRREPSSDEEYDEFGRKKRKRKAESQEKVGITEAAVIKKLPPSVLQKETNKDHVMPALGSNKSRPNTRPQEKVKGSLSDGSVCEVVPLSKATVSRYQQLNANRQDNMPLVKTNGVPTRKRFISSGDRDQTASSGYETSSKKSKRDSTISPIIKYNPVMENMVSSTNNDVVYKFAGPTPAEDFQVTYTIEERVKAAAYAIVYNNCKISTDKFEALYDKPAPDFKTIFGWRQRLLTTGCLVDSHVDKKDIPDRTVANVAPKTDNKVKPASKLPNPDEIILSSGSDDEINNIQQKPLPRSVSAETLLIAADKSAQAAGSAASTGDDRASHDGSHSRSSHRRTRSSSRDSEDSSYPDSDSEKIGAKSSNSRSASCSKSARQSIKNSDSDSVSYNSEDDNFLSRVFPNREGRKRRKIKRRTVVPPAPPVKVNCYVPKENQSFEGYSTVKPAEKSPLVTGNIYTMNLRNMNVKPRTNVPVDIDNCSTEYVPTKLGSTANKNYQDFKNSVRKKGFWAKGNSTNIVKNRHSISMDVANIPRPLTMKPQEQTVPNYSTNTQSYNTPHHRLATNQTTDFTKDDVDQFANTEQYLPFESSQTRPQDKWLRPITIIPGQMKPVQMMQPHKPVPKPIPKPIQNAPQPLQVKPAQKPVQKIPVQIPLIPKSPSNTDSIFALVQSSSAGKNRSIMDIFGNNGPQKSPDREKELEKYDSVRKMYETWDEDDDALYKDTDSARMQSPTQPTPSPLSITSARAQSPMSNMLYTSDNQSQQEVTPNKVTADLIKDKQDMLLDLLKDFQNKEIGEVLSPIKQITPQKQLSPQKQSTPQTKIDEKIMKHSKAHINAMTKLYNRPEPIPTELSHELLHMSGDIDIADENYCEQNTVKQISPSKKVHVLESVTIQPGSTCNDGSPKDQNMLQYRSPDQKLDENTKAAAAIQQVVESSEESPEKVSQQAQPTTQAASELNLSNLLAGINTNTLLLALQNLQQLSQNSSLNSSNQNNTEQQNASQNVQAVETINLTNDEDWEKESNRDGSIERQLQRLDGNTGDGNFLGDIFDPGPVRLQTNVARKLNLSVDNLEDKSDNQTQNENGTVVGNFKSFALPKPIMLNRLKIPVKTVDKPKRSDVKKMKRKKKSKSGSSHDAAEGEEDDEEESGDEADLAKYDLWGSDAEQGNSSKNENGERSKDGENSKEVEPKSPSEKCDRNDRNASPASKSSKRRSRSSSSSSTSSSSSSSSQSSSQGPQNKFDDFNLNSERESSPKGRKSRSRSRSPRARSAGRRKSRDSRSAGESRSHEPRDKEWPRDRERRDRSRGNREDRKERRYSRDGGNHYSSRGRHR